MHASRAACMSLDQRLHAVSFPVVNRGLTSYSKHPSHALVGRRDANRHDQDRPCAIQKEGLKSPG